LDSIRYFPKLNSGPKKKEGKEEERNFYMILVGKSEGERPLGRHRHGSDDNIKIYLREIGFSGTDCFHLAQDRDQWRALVDKIMNLRVLYNIG
jgi:hypothetical protein